MRSTAIPGGSVTARARGWRNGVHEAVCDVIEPWADGTVARATRYPTYYDFNVLRVEQETGLTVGELAAEADRALAGLEHRRIDFDLIGAAEPRREAFEAVGWKTTRLLWMRHEAPLPDAGPGPPVEEVEYDETADLRLSWHLEDAAELEYEGYAAGAREIAIKKGARMLAVREQGVPIAFAQVQWGGDAAEINSVYVHPEHRGRGLGTAVTRAAVTAAAGAGDLWIVADDQDRAKDLYARLGFRAAWTTMEFLLLR
jgi:ribosomal protein S18 acetylase RimI-like enzyme